MRRALIVDDSKTAQIRLQKLLKPYDLVIDTADSAEEALGYLSYKSPVVIFLDHHMEGMNGFEALKILKANPNTAVIPVIMYTSEKGDVYLGQARALGALDTLSKDIMKSSSLEKVLAGLRITPSKEKAISGSTAPRTTKSADLATPKPAPGLNPNPTNKPSSPPTTKTARQPQEELNLVRAQIARLFEIHITDVRTQISENTKFVVRRLTNEIAKMETRRVEFHIDDKPEADTEEDGKVSSKSIGWGLKSLIFALTILTGFLTVQTYSNNANLAHLSEDQTELKKLNSELMKISQSSDKRLSTLLSQQSGLAYQDSMRSTNNSNLLAAISWAMGIDMQFPFDKAPLEEWRIENLYNLAYKLEAAKFEGTVYVDLHFGDFCMNASSASTLQLADGNTTVTDCTMTSNITQDFPTDNYISHAYINFEQSVDVVENNVIRFKVNSLGTSSPAYPYPPNTSATTAAEWNAIAAKNNQITIRFDQN